MNSTKRAGEDYVYPLPSFRALPPLPPVRTVDPDKYMGPTEESNWVIYSRLLVGAYPSSTHDPVNTAILSSILKLGITTFVCLQQEYQHEGVTEAEWRSGHKLRPYIFDAIKLVDSLPPSYFPTQIKPDGLEFVHFPIVDCAIANDASVLQLCHDLCARLLKGEVMYVHCFSEDHEILTEKGFRSIHELEHEWKKDAGRMVRIASYNKDTEQITYEPCLDVVIKPYQRSQTMIELTEPHEYARWESATARTEITEKVITNDTVSSPASTAGYSFIVTPDHDMFTHLSSSASTTTPKPSSSATFTKKKASHLYTLHHQDQSSGPASSVTASAIHMLTSATNGVDPSSLSSSFSSASLLIEAIINHFQFTKEEQLGILCYILGRYIVSLPYRTASLTGIDHDNETFSSSSFYLITDNEENDTDDITTLLNELQIPYTNITTDNHHTIHHGIWITAPYLSTWLHQQVSAFPSSSSPLPSTILPIVTLSDPLCSWLYGLPSQPLQQFLNGVSYHPSPQPLPYSSLESMILTDSVSYRDTLLHLCLHAGYSVAFEPYTLESISLWTVKYTRDPRITQPILVPASASSSPSRSPSSFTGIRKVSYTGRTWCVTVPSGLLIARRIQRHPIRSHEITQASRPTIVGNCWGGHGRTGTVVSIMLGLLYGLSPLDAMRWVQFCHDLRIAPMGTASPQTETQRQQVIRVLNAVRQAQGIPKNPKNNTLLSPQPIPSSSRTNATSGGNGLNLLKSIENNGNSNHKKGGNGTAPFPSSSSSSTTTTATHDTSPTYTVEIPAPANVVAMASDITRNVSTAVVKPRSGSVPGRNNPVPSSTTTTGTASSNGTVVSTAATATRTIGNSLTPQGKVSNSNNGSSTNNVSPRTRRLSGLPNGTSTGNHSANGNTSNNNSSSTTTTSSSVAGSGLNAVSNNTRPRNIVALTPSQQQIQQQLKQSAITPNNNNSTTSNNSNSSVSVPGFASSTTLESAKSTEASPPSGNSSAISSPVRSVHTQSYEATTTDTKIDTLPHYDATGLLNIHSPRPEIATDLVHEPSIAAVLSDPRATAIAPLASSTATMLGINKTRGSSSGNIMTGNKQNRTNSITNTVNGNGNDGGNTTSSNSWASIVSSSPANGTTSALPVTIVNTPGQPKANDPSTNRRPVTADNSTIGIPSPNGKLTLTPTKMDPVLAKIPSPPKNSPNSSPSSFGPSSAGLPSSSSSPSPEKPRVGTAKVRPTNTNINSSNNGNPPTPNKPTLTPTRTTNGSPTNPQVMTGVMRAGTGNVITSSISSSAISSSSPSGTGVSPRPQTAVTPSSVPHNNSTINSTNTNAVRLTTPPLSATRTHQITGTNNSTATSQSNSVTSPSSVSVPPTNTTPGPLSVATPTPTVSTSTPKESNTPSNHSSNASPLNRGYASAAAAGLASAIAAYSPSSSRPGMNNGSVPSRARIAVARQLREPHTANENTSRTNNMTTPGDKKDSMVSRNMLFRSPIPKTSEKSTLPPPGSILPNSTTNNTSGNDSTTNTPTVPLTNPNSPTPSTGTSPKPTILPSGGSYMAAAVARKAIQSPVHYPPNLNNNSSSSSSSSNNNNTYTTDGNVTNESKTKMDNEGNGSNGTAGGMSPAVANNGNSSSGSTPSTTTNNRPRVRVVMRTGSGLPNDVSNASTDPTTLPSSIVGPKTTTTTTNDTNNSNNSSTNGGSVSNDSGGNSSTYGSNGILPIGLLPGYIPNTNKNGNSGGGTINTNGINVKVRPLVTSPFTALPSSMP